MRKIVCVCVSFVCMRLIVCVCACLSVCACTTTNVYSSTFTTYYHSFHFLIVSKVSFLETLQLGAASWINVRIHDVPVGFKTRIAELLVNGSVTLACQTLEAGCHVGYGDNRDGSPSATYVASTTGFWNGLALQGQLFIVRLPAENS
jgi:hypothetical protein